MIRKIWEGTQVALAVLVCFAACAAFVAFMISAGRAIRFGDGVLDVNVVHAAEPAEVIVDTEAPDGFVNAPDGFDLDTSTFDRQFQPFGICDAGDIVACAKYAQGQCRDLYGENATTVQHMTLNLGQGWERVCVYQCRFHDQFRIARCRPAPLRPDKPKPVGRS